MSTAKHCAGPTTVQLPGGVGQVTTGVVCAVAAAAAAVAGWAISGAAAAAPLALVGGVALAAAIEDARTGRIPNTLVLTGLIIVACSWGFVATLDNRLMRPLAVDIIAGMILSGAPLLFLVWFVAPRLIGGGDWKLLAVLGAMAGVLAPATASTIPVVAFAAAIVVAAGRRRREVRLGPYLAAGYLVALAVTAARPELFDSWYAGSGASR